MNRLGKVCFFLSLLCLFLSLGLRAALSGWMPFMGVGLFFAVLFALIGTLTNLKTLVSWVRSDVFHFTLKSAALCFMTLVFLLSVNVIVAQQMWFFDLTKTGLNTLQPLTKSLLKALNEPLELVFFHTGSAEGRRLERQVRDELVPYQRLSSWLKYESYSIFERPDLVDNYKVGDEPAALFMSFKGRRQRISSLEERDVTNALLKVTREKKRVYFITNGEARSYQDSSTFGLSFLAEQIQRLHYEIAEVDLEREIPADAILLIWAGPQKPVPMTSLKRLESYLLGGGGVWLAWDPDGAPVPQELLKRWGIHHVGTFLFDQEPPSGQSPLLAMVHPGERAHEISRRLEEGKNPFFFVASALEIQPTDLQVKVTPLLEFLPNAQARSDLRDNSPVVQTGRQFAALISEGLEQGQLARLLVSGDSDFLTNQFSQQPAIFDFIMASLNYLSQDEDLLRLRPPLPENDQMVLTQTQINLFLLFFILPLVGLFFLLAVFFKLRSFF